MDMPNDESTESQVIQLKPCPRCETAIRTSLRYGNVIKEQLQYIEKVKKKVHGDPSELEETKKRLQTRLTVLKNTLDVEDEMKELKRLDRSVNRLSQGIRPAAVIENQVTLMERYYAMSQKLKQKLVSQPACSKGHSECRLESRSIHVYRMLCFAYYLFLLIHIVQKEKSKLRFLLSELR